MKSDLKVLGYIILLFIAWRAMLFFITFAGLSFLPHYIADKQITQFPTANINYFFTWAQWDGGQFRGIVENGYLPFQTVFFPAFPLFIYLLYNLGVSSLTAGLFISNVSAVFALFFFYKLAALDLKIDAIKKALFFLLIFPTSFYLGAVYSESLFLLGCLGSFYFARKNRWFIAFLFAQVAVATRLVGLGLIFALLIEYLTYKKFKFSFRYIWNFRVTGLLIFSLIFWFIFSRINLFLIQAESWLMVGILSHLIYAIKIISVVGFLVLIFELVVRNINYRKIFTLPTLYIAMSFWPILAYIYYQKAKFNNPLGFLTNESAWGRKLSFPWEAPINYFNQITGVGIFYIGNNAYFLIEFSIFILFSIGFVLSLYKLRISYAFFYLFLFILPLLSGTLIAYPRYVLVIFPFFLLLGKVQNELLEKLIIFFFFSLLILFSIMYINHYWVT